MDFPRKLIRSSTSSNELFIIELDISFLLIIAFHSPVFYRESEVLFCSKTIEFCSDFYWRREFYIVKPIDSSAPFFNSD